LEETRKEKRLRYLLILFFVSITAGAFFFKYSDMSKGDENHTPLAVVLQESTGDNENPIVVMYNFQQNQHTLAQYEIKRNADFRFVALDAVKLKQAPSEMVLDKDTGVWVKVSDKWHYFDRYLQQQERSEELIGKSTYVPFTIEKDNDDIWMMIEGMRKMKMDLNEKVSEVHPLSNNRDLWLLVTESGAKISTFD
jgi:hypothetical protein